MTKPRHRDYLAMSIPGLSLVASPPAGTSYIEKFGANRDVDTGTTPESAWNVGGLYPWSSLAEPQALEAVSDDVNDTAAGTGARTLMVNGLDADYMPKTQTVSLNGTTAVALSGTWKRVFRARVMTAGTGGTNAGNVSVQLSGGGQVVANCEPGLAQTTLGIYTVDAVSTGYMVSFEASTVRSGAQVASVGVFVRENEDSVFQLKREYGTPASRDFKIPILLPAMSDVDIRVLDVTANNTQVVVEFDVVMLSNL